MYGVRIKRLISINEIKFGSKRNRRIGYLESAAKKIGGF
jgi:hypothetical protein